MTTQLLKDVSWYIDKQAVEKNEPGVCHSYMASLATALNYRDKQINPAWLMGAGGFAFRFFANKIMCPSAMSIFDFTLILPEAVEQVGYHCNYISRLWDEDDKELERKQQAHEAIVGGIDRDTPAILWDVADAEWGLIVGYDQDQRIYHTLTHRGEPSTLAFDKLGQNGIDILSVAICAQKNNRTHPEIITNSLRVAVDHFDQKEWSDRPDYQNGSAAYDMWAKTLQKWALLIQAGKADNIGVDLPNFAKYYAACHYSARCYAGDYLKMIADDNENLNNAHLAYSQVASCLKPTWQYFSHPNDPDPDILTSLAQNIETAKTAEQEGVKQIRDYLNS